MAHISVISPRYYVGDFETTFSLHASDETPIVSKITTNDVLSYRILETVELVGRELEERLQY